MQIDWVLSGSNTSILQIMLMSSKKENRRRIRIVSSKLRLCVDKNRRKACESYFLFSGNKAILIRNPFNEISLEPRLIGPQE